MASDRRPAIRGGYSTGQGIQVQRDPDKTGPYNNDKLSSPFPYYGGKSRWIDIVFARIGKVGVWSEPCCGTAVMTLNNPEPAAREVICDLNAFICNFYRAVCFDYEATAYHADWPTNHFDLTARPRWLLAQGPELSERMTSDPDDFDAKIAGWWCWGQSSWIGHGWCDGTNWEQRPLMDHKSGGRGVNIQRERLPVEDKRPKVPDGGGSGVSAQRDQIPHVNNASNTGQGVSAQRDNLRARPGTGYWQQVRRPGGVQQQRDQMPHVNHMPGGKGVSAQRVAVGGPSDQRPHVQVQGGSGVQMQRTGGHGATNVDSHSWPSALWHPRRLPAAAVVSPPSRRGSPASIILNRSWESALTDSVLQQTPSSPKPEVGVFLDPPYRTTRSDGGKRSTGLYQGDAAGVSDDVATASYKWAVEHGDKYRVAYCMHAGDFDVPPGWTVETMGFSGHRDEAKKESSVDCIIFSPRCVPPTVDPQQEFGW